MSDFIKYAADTERRCGELEARIAELEGELIVASGGTGARGIDAILTDTQVDEFAKLIALGNNGGDWSAHYTEDQRERWRNIVRKLAVDIVATIKANI